MSYSLHTTSQDLMVGLPWKNILHKEISGLSNYMAIYKTHTNNYSSKKRKVLKRKVKYFFIHHEEESGGMVKR